LVLGIVFVALAVGVGLAGLFLVRRNVALATLEQHNDVAGFIIAVVGVLYAVMLGFLVVTVWGQFDSTQANAHNEATTLEALYRDAVIFGPQAQPLQRGLLAYGSSVANREWPDMELDQSPDPATDRLYDNLWPELHAVHSTTPDQNSFYAAAITSLNQLGQDRSVRLDDATRTIPLALWAVLLIGAIITVGFTYFFGVTHVGAHALMVAALSAMIGISIFVILSLDLPFSGDLGVKPTALRSTIHELRAIPVTPPASR
jgi:hypothetical protein